MILATYKIAYENGITQTKNLISHDEYLQKVKPLEIEIDFLNSTLKKKSKDPKDLEKKHNLNLLKKKLREIVGDYYFTDKSPFYYAIESGFLELTPQQGGKHKIIMQKIDR